jgi:hypothetical protein
MIMRVGQNDKRIKDRPEPLPRPREPAPGAMTPVEEMPPPTPPVVDNAPAELERLKQYRIDHDKLHEELAARAGDVEEEQARAHGEMMQALHELMQMIGTMLAAQGHAVESDDKGTHDYGPRAMEFQIRRGQNGLIDRVIATPKLDG